MDIEEILKSLGLNDKEVKVYLALLSLGSVPASLLGKRTGITRSTAQYTCQQLEKKGLISSIQKNNSFIYSPEPPEKLIFLLDSQKKQIEQKEDNVKRIIGDLKGMINPLAVLPKVKFFEGLKGVKDVLLDTLTTKTELLTYSDVAGYMRHLYEFNKKEYAPKRKELGIFEKVIIPDEKSGIEYMLDYVANEFTQIAFIDHKLFPFASEINIYDDKISYVTFSDSGNHVGLIIENMEIVKTQRSIFDMTWNYAIKEFKKIMDEFKLKQKNQKHI